MFKDPVKLFIKLDYFYKLQLIAFKKKKNAAFLLK